MSSRTWWPGTGPCPGCGRGISTLRGQCVVCEYGELHFKRTMKKIGTIQVPRWAGAKKSIEEIEHA